MQSGDEGRRAARAAASARASYSLRLALFYGALFLIYGVHLPYLPVWLDGRGMTPQEIAVITAAPLFLRVLVTPSVAMLADRTGLERPLVIGLAALTFLLAVALSQTASFLPIFLAAVPFAIALSTAMPLTETIAVAGVRAHGLDYGRMRLWGSLTFVGAGFAGGWLIDHVGAEAVMGCLIVATAATAAMAWLLPGRISAGQPGEASPARSGGLAEAAKLMRSPVFLAFLLAAGAAQGSHGMFYTFGALTWHAQGISTAAVGGLWAIAIAGEVALFAYSGSVIVRWGPVALLVAGTAGALVRWALMSFSPPLAALVLLQLLHTLTYGASHLGAMHFIARAVPASAQGTAQALYATVASGLMIGGATLAAGWLNGHLGARAYWAMAGLAAFGLAGALFVRARWAAGTLLWRNGAAAE